MTQAKPQIFWIVGKLIDYKKHSWYYVAIFDTQKKAIKRCSDKSFFIAPVTLNKFNAGNKIKGEWKGAYYPNFK